MPELQTPTAAPLLNAHARPTRVHYRILAMCWAGWLFDFYDLMLFSFLLVPIKKHLGLSAEALSLMMGTSLAATAVGGVIFGYLADRVGRKPVLTWTILMFSIGTALCGFATSWQWLLVFRVLTGLGVGGEWATGQTMVGETFPAAMRARFAAIVQTGAPLGIALASLVGGFVEPAFAEWFGASTAWRACFWISLAPALLVIAMRKWLPESDVWQAQRERAEPREASAFVQLAIEPALRRSFLLGLVLALTDMSAYWFTYSWLPTYLYEKLDFSMARSGLWMLVTQAGGFTGYLTFGALADRFGRRVSYSVFSMVWATGLLAITLFWSSIAVHPAVALACMFAVGVGTGNFSGYGPIFAELFPTRVRNTAMGAAFNLARGAQFFTPLIITHVAARAGLGGGIALASVFAVFTGLWVWLLPETRGTRITS